MAKRLEYILCSQKATRNHTQQTNFIQIYQIPLPIQLYIFFAFFKKVMYWENIMI